MPGEDMNGEGMNDEDRRAAKAACKEAKTSAGIYVVRCSASSQAWVGQAPNVDRIQNQLWFGFKTGRDPRREPQAAWTAHGEDSFSFEILERADAEAEGYVLKSQLKARLEHWRTALIAAAI